MLEKQRLTYLEHLGIDNYIPTYVLPHAAPSQILPDQALMEPTAFSTADVKQVEDVQGCSTINADVEQETEAETLETVSKEQQSIPSPAIINSLLDEVPSSVEVSEKKQSVVESSSPSLSASLSEGPTISEAPIRFALNIWRIKNEILVIDSRQLGAALPTEKLLQNILRSIHLPLAQLPTSELLRWPLFKDDKYNPQEENEARAMVQAYISAQINKNPVKYVLLLGKEAIRFSLTIEQSIDEFYENNKGQALTQSQWQATVLLAPSLVDMLLEPLQKRVTWQALQTLLVEA